MPLKINGQIIDQVCTYKYLGITIDEKLHWSDHINNTKSKANKRLYFVRKLVQFKVDRTLVTLFYKSVIESVLSFCITFFFFFFFFLGGGGGGGTIRRETV